MLCPGSVISSLTESFDFAGQPLLQNILEGRYYMQNTYERPLSASSQRPAFTKGILIDEELGQPLVKSLVEGQFYFPKDEMLLKSRKVVNNSILVPSMRHNLDRRFFCKQSRTDFLDFSGLYRAQPQDDKGIQQTCSLNTT